MPSNKTEIGGGVILEKFRISSIVMKFITIWQKNYETIVFGYPYIPYFSRSFMLRSLRVIEFRKIVNSYK
jgi:undecaprenyl pyrophosphate synthase